MSNPLPTPADAVLKGAMVPQAEPPANPGVPVIKPSDIKPAVIAETQKASAAANAVVAGPTKPRVDVDKEQDPELAAPPVVTPKVDLTIPQRMGAVRDALKRRYSKAEVTIRLDVTTSPPGTEYIVYISGGLPHGHRALSTGLYMKAETLRAVEEAVAVECDAEARA